MSLAYLGLGSNLGDRLKNLEKAISFINKQEAIKLLKISSIYETEPIGYINQPNFLNCVILIETNLSPKDLLSITKEIEQHLKRERTIRWGPRTIDIDILLFDNILFEDEDLTIPHPRICERAFVLVPLLEIDENIKIRNSLLAKDCLKNVKEQKLAKVSYINLNML